MFNPSKNMYFAIQWKQAILILQMLTFHDASAPPPQPHTRTLIYNTELSMLPLLRLYSLLQYSREDFQALHFISLLAFSNVD